MHIDKDYIEKMDDDFNTADAISVLFDLIRDINSNVGINSSKELCEKAEALKDSTDWKTTAEVLSKLQKEWKTIGPVAHKFRIPSGSALTMLATTSSTKRTRLTRGSARRKRLTSN